MISENRSRVLEAVRYIKARIDKPAVLGLVTGTGLGESVGAIQVESSLQYGEIPGFPAATTESHPGRLLAGVIQGKQVIVLQGRLHLYEGYTPVEVTFPLRVLQELGVRRLILTNAAGGLNPLFRPGDIMTITDHINLTGTSPLIGPHEDGWGERFPDMSATYDRNLIALAQTAAKAEGLSLRQGVYAGSTGPALETPAEVRYLQRIGADAVGFSTVQEVLAAVQARMRILGLSVITNVHDPDRPVAATAAEIIALARGAAPKLGAIIAAVVRGL
ncbi:MAG: purine-nucleoside phosphorylase [Desulfobacterales bacterium]|nr:purine-nucleoside phosphorylase [Desulfobacterales bacterium]